MRLETTIQSETKTIRVLTRVKDNHDDEAMLTSVYDCDENGACKSWGPYLEIEAEPQVKINWTTVQKQHRDGIKRAMEEIRGH